jgi:hypothetical protein
MNLNDLRAIVRRGESEKAEFKRSTGQRGEGIRGNLCALVTWWWETTREPPRHEDTKKPQPKPTAGGPRGLVHAPPLGVR